MGRGDRPFLGKARLRPGQHFTAVAILSWMLLYSTGSLHDFSRWFSLIPEFWSCHQRRCTCIVCPAQTTVWRKTDLAVWRRRVDRQVQRQAMTSERRSARRQRSHFTSVQLRQLETVFQHGERYPDATTRQRIAAWTDLSEIRVRVSFSLQNYVRQVTGIRHVGFVYFFMSAAIYRSRPRLSRRCSVIYSVIQ